MSELRPISLATLLLVCVAAPRAEGQASSPLAATIARGEARVDSLRREQGAATLLVMGGGVVTRAAPRVDDLELVAVGGYRLRTNHTPLPLRAAATDAWGRLTDYFGDATTGFLARPLVVQGLDPDTSAGELDGIADLTVPWDIAPDLLGPIVMNAGGMPRGDSGVISWLGIAPRPAISVDRALEEGFDQLALSPFARGHACVGGDLVACREALGLGGAGVTAFPEREDRRRAVLLLAESPRPPAEGERMEQCIAGRDDAVCSAILAETAPGSLPAVTDRRSRGPLLELALRMGGTGAFTRLRGSAGRPIEVRLALAASMPVDSLLSVWRGEILRVRHAARPWSSRVGVVGLAWVGIFLACALWSSRWRAD